MRNRTLLAAAVALLAAVLAGAQHTPFTFQGRLTDAAVPASGIYDLQFKLFDSSISPGNQVGSTVSIEDVTVLDGLFTVVLDFTGATSTSDRLWLEIGVRPGTSGAGFTVLSPRQELSPGPASFYSRSGIGTDVQCTGCVEVGDLGAGSAASGQVLTSTSASSMDWVTPVWTTGTGTAGQVAYWSARSALSGSTRLLWDSPSGTLSADTLALPATSGTAGRVTLGGSLFLHGYGTGSTYLGTGAGGAAGLGSDNTGIGADALAVTSGASNTAVGWSSLTANTLGDDNTAVGREALANNTNAGRNTAVGSYALHSQSYDFEGVSTGTGNTAIGYYALYLNQPTGVFTGKENTAVGLFTLRSNTLGANNTAVGSSGLYGNTIGNNNSALGYTSLFNNTTAGENVAVGARALFTQSFANGGTGWSSENTAVGFDALYSNQPTATNNGRRNTAIGSASLRANTTGSINTALGYHALNSNTDGAGNTGIGASSLEDNTAGNSNTAVGFSSLAKNTAATGNVALGMDALAEQSFANGGTSWITGNTAVGTHALSYNDPTSDANGRHNTGVGYGAGETNVTGSENTFLGYYADATVSGLTNATALGSGARVNASNKVRVGNTTVTVIEGQVDWSFPSDIRRKKDVRELGMGLELIMRLRPVEYRLKEGNDRLDMGFIAQDIEALLGDSYNILGIGEDAERTLSLRRGELIAPLVKAVQEQQALIDSQRATIDRLRALLETQNAALAAVSERVEALEEGTRVPGAGR